MNFKIANALHGAIIIMLIFLVGCSKSSQTMPSEMPDDFGFSLSYGINGVQKVDTFNDTVVKDLIVNGTAEEKIALKEEEMQAIYEKMKRINVMHDLDIAKEENCEVIPAAHYKWEIVVNGQVRKIEYVEHCGNVPKDVKELEELKDFIHATVSAKEEYKKLPEAEGGYE